MGGTFSTMFTVDFLSAKGSPCFLCLNDEYRFDSKIEEIVKSVAPDKILDLESL